MTPDDIATRLARLDACAISDALHQLGLPPSVTGLAPRAAKRRVSGETITVKLAAGKPPEDTTPRHLHTTAIDMAAPGQVIVVEQRAGIECAGWGGILSNAARGRIARRRQSENPPISFRERMSADCNVSPETGSSGMSQVGWLSRAFMQT